jgi:DNA-binding NarL/FixJ family response regulator
LVLNKSKENPLPSKILIVEDDDFYFDSLQRHFKRLNATVFHAMSLHAATNALVDNDFDLIVIDLGLPDFGQLKEEEASRMTVLNTIISNSPSSIHIVITGRFSQSEAEECKKAGAKGYFSKSRLNAPTLATLLSQLMNSDFVIHSGDQIENEINVAFSNLSDSEEESLQWVRQRPNSMKRRELFELMARHFGFKNAEMAEQKYKRARSKELFIKREMLEEKQSYSK